HRPSDLRRCSLASPTSVVAVFTFFFSSRRRHTRSTRDWSSDVCSSDLACTTWGGGCRSRRKKAVTVAIRKFPPPARGLVTRAERSEERRVGKECSGGRTPAQGMTKEWQRRVIATQTNHHGQR